MDCRDFLLRYSDYDDSRIPPHEAERFRQHMAECASCARYDRVLRKGRMLARQLSRPEPNPDLLPRLRMRLREQGTGRGVGSARLTAGLAAATILMVAATSVQLLDSSAARTAPTLQEIPVSAPRPALLPRLALLPALPARRPATLEAWGSGEVAPADTSSYSPLVTGPPVYRVSPPSRSGVRTTHTARRALD